jgi:3-oxoacyl-[acyl-carrier protein] reductase
MRLNGKVAMITGAARGIGKAYAVRFAQEGASVAIVDLRDREAGETAQQISAAGGKAISIRADVTNEAEMADAAKRTVDELGRIDILVNNAALYGDMNIADQTLEYFEKIMHINVGSVIVASRAIFPYMKQQGGGAIINVASTAAYPLPLPSMGEPQTVPISGYAVSKAAVINVTKSMAGALGQCGVRVNAIAPGLTMSEATQQIVPGFIMERITEATALKKPLDPADLAGTAVFLASDESALMTGQVLVVDAGLIMLG